MLGCPNAVTTTGTELPVPGGTGHWIIDSVNSTIGQFAPPTDTAAAVRSVPKLAPTIVITVPPAVDTDAGETPLMVGAGGISQSFPV
jgi:hypothetical protein